MMAMEGRGTVAADDRLYRLYEELARGDFTSSRELFAETYRHHVPGLGIEYSGRDQAIEGLRAVFDQLQLRIKADGVTRHGPFLVGYTTSRSRLHVSPVCGIHVFRVEGNAIVEGWVLSPPPG